MPPSRDTPIIKPYIVSARTPTRAHQTYPAIVVVEPDDSSAGKLPDVGVFWKIGDRVGFAVGNPGIEKGACTEGRKPGVDCGARDGAFVGVAVGAGEDLVAT